MDLGIGWIETHLLTFLLLRNIFRQRWICWGWCQRRNWIQYVPPTFKAVTNTGLILPSHYIRYQVHKLVEQTSVAQRAQSPIILLSALSFFAFSFFLVGAGFYLNATQAPWDKNWKMYDYIAKELPQVLAANLPIVCLIHQFNDRRLFCSLVQEQETILLIGSGKRDKTDIWIFFVPLLISPTHLSLNHGLSSLFYLLFCLARISLARP